MTISDIPKEESLSKSESLSKKYKETKERIKDQKYKTYSLNHNLIMFRLGTEQ